MADKLPQTVVVLPTFVDGEIPPAAKLTVLAAQTRAANRKLEKAVGDHLGQSKPYWPTPSNEDLSRGPEAAGTGSVLIGTVDTLPLDIASLSRLIGPSSLLNPHHFAGDGTVREIVESVTDVNEYRNVHHFKYKPTNNTITIVESTPGVYTSSVASIDLVLADGDYFYDWANSAIWSYAAIGDHDYDGTPDGGWTCTFKYEVDPNEFAGAGSQQNSTFNTIPDIAQLEAAGSALVDVVGAVAGYQRFQLPLCTHQAMPDRDGGGITVLDESYVNLTDNNIRLEVPRVLQDNMGAGEQIPEGFMVIKNYTTGQAYTEAEILYVDATHVDVGNVDLSAEIAAGDLLYLVTVGASLTEAVYSLRSAVRYPGRRVYGGEPVRVEDIAGLIGGYGYYPTSDTGWHNPTPQYLHRDGYNASEGQHNDYNVMRGDFVLGSAAAGVAPGEYYTTGEDSVKLIYAHASNAESFWDDSVYGQDAGVTGAVVHDGRHVYEDEVMFAGGAAMQANTTRDIWIPATAFTWFPANTPASATALLTNVHPYIAVSSIGTGIWDGYLDLRPYIFDALGIDHTTLKAAGDDDHGALIQDVYFYYHIDDDTSGTAKITAEGFHDDLSTLPTSGAAAYSGSISSFSYSKINSDHAATYPTDEWYLISEVAIGAEINAGHSYTLHVELTNDPGSEPSPEFYGVRVFVNERNIAKST